MNPSRRPFSHPSSPASNRDCLVIFIKLQLIQNFYHNGCCSGTACCAVCAYPGLTSLIVSRLTVSTVCAWAPLPPTSRLRPPRVPLTFMSSLATTGSSCSRIRYGIQMRPARPMAHTDGVVFRPTSPPSAPLSWVPSPSSSPSSLLVASSSLVW